MRAAARAFRPNRYAAQSMSQRAGVRPRICTATVVTATATVATNPHHDVCPETNTITGVPTMTSTATGTRSRALGRIPNLLIGAAS